MAHRTATWLPKNLPTRLGYARDQTLRSPFTKSEPRHLEPANKAAPAPGDFAAVNHSGGAGVTRQLRESGIVFFRLQLRAHRSVFFHRCALALITINPGSLSHKEVLTIMPALQFATARRRNYPKAP